MRKEFCEFEKIDGGSFGLEYKIFDFIEENKPKNVLEIGTQFGKTASFICLALNEIHKNGFNYVCVDPFVNEGSKAKSYWFNNLINNELFNIKPTLIGDYIRNVDLSKIFNNKIDFCFIDGNHETENVIGDFEQVEPLLSDKCITIFHDSNGDSVRNGLTYLENKYTNYKFDYFSEHLGYCVVIKHD